MYTTFWPKNILRDTVKIETIYAATHSNNLREP